MSSAPKISKETAAAPATNFIRNIIDSDLAAGKHAQRRWSGTPGLASQQLAGPLDPAKIRTRFPPEPNGYLHFGHAKSICLNFGLARDYGGRCHLRFDDTNPEKEEKEYVDSIIDAVHWLGFSWQDDKEDNLYYASDYFDWMIACAEYLIEAGHAYIDSQSAEEMRLNRGTRYVKYECMFKDDPQNYPIADVAKEEIIGCFIKYYRLVMDKGQANLPE